MIAAVYCRVSTDEQARQGLSLKVQEARCREAADRHGAEAVDVYVDDGYSGRSLDRPALQRLLGRLARYDRIYVLDQSRWTRDPGALEELRECLLAAGVALVPLAAPLDQQTPAGRLVSRVIVASDRFQIDVARAKALDALTRLTRGGHHHGRCPLGYERPRDEAGGIMRDRPLVVVPAEARIVLRIYGEYAAGRPVADICRGLIADRVPGKRGRVAWRAATVMRMLSNPTYRGRVRWQGHTYPAGHEPIVPADLWQRVQARRARDAGVHPSRRATLSPLLRCGICDGSVQRAGSAPGSYRCRDRARWPSRDRHEPICKRVPIVHMVIWTWTRHLITEDLLVAALENTRPERYDESALAAELEELEGRIAYNLEAARAGALPMDMLVAQQRPLLARREELRRALMAGSAAVSADDGAWLRRLGADGAIDRLAASEDRGLQRRVLETIYEVIYLHPGGLVFHHLWPGIGPHGIAYPVWRGPAHGWSEISLTPWSPS